MKTELNMTNETAVVNKVILPDGTTSRSSKPLLVTVTPFVEVVSKAIAGLAIALYASGFLIVSLHHSQYGFAETNPFRARILAAGAWFFFLTAIPLAAVASHGRRRQLTWTRFAQLLYPYYAGCLSVQLLTSRFFNFTDVPASSAPQISTAVWVQLVVGLLVFTVLYALWQSKKVPPIVSALASAGLALYSVQTDVRELVFKHAFGVGAITVWFFGIGVAALLAAKIRLQEGEWGWSKSVSLILSSLFVFATYYYPQLKSAWGGGAPVEVTVFFSKDSPVKPNQSVTVNLVDETDVGYYIVAKDEKTAIYIPRNAVSLVYFSNKASGSKLLP